MKKFVLFFVGLIGLTLISSCAKDEENLNGKIAGLVTDYANANTPIAGATVTLNSKGLTKTTGADGRFEFTDITPGTYTLQIAANNYQATTKQVTVVAGQTANCDVQLTKSGASVEINPTTLTFGKGVEQLSFNITNNGTQSLTYSISNAPDFVEVSPASGTVAAKAKNAISVHVLNRSSITTNRNGQITVNVGNDSYVVSIAVTNNTQTDPNQGSDPNQGGNTPGGNTNEVAVTRGLLALYTFDDENANNSYRSINNGVIEGTPQYVQNGNGKAISLDQKQVINIPNNMLNGKTAYTISLWIKDFGSGMIFGTIRGNYYSSPSFRVNNNNQFNIVYNNSSTINSNFSLQAYQASGWHMVSVVFNRANNQILVFMDGQRVDALSASYIESEGNSMRIGGNLDGNWADPMIIDNVRIHSVSLDDSEIKTIYDSEK